MKRKVRSKRKSVRVKTSRSKRVRRTKKSRNVYRKKKRKSNRKSKNKMKGGATNTTMLETFINPAGAGAPTTATDLEVSSETLAPVTAEVPATVAADVLAPVQDNDIRCVAYAVVDYPPDQHFEFTLRVTLKKDNYVSREIKKRWSEVVGFNKQMLALLTEPNGWFKKVVPDTLIPQTQHNLQYHFHIKYPELPRLYMSSMTLNDKTGNSRGLKLNTYFRDLVAWEKDRQLHSPGDSDLFTDVPFVSEFFA